MKNIIRRILLLCILTTLFTCKRSPLIFTSTSQDIQLGQQVSAQIAADTSEYPILPEKDYPNAYMHIRRILNNILVSDEIKHKNNFFYDSIKIINKDVLNAFATPGGFIYVYTGLIHYLDSEDHLAGVLGHEIAHAARRHSIQQMEKEFGVQAIISAAIGEGQVNQIVTGLLNLKFSRSHESDADEYSVIYLSDVKQYQCNGAAGFFQKIENLNQEPGGKVPEFFSTHPNPDNRIEAINEKADQLTCEKKLVAPTSYQDFKNSLP